MINKGIVRGSAQQAIPLIIDKDTVYVHTNIHTVEVDDIEETRIEYEYNEVQYTKDGYIKLVTEQSKSDIDYIAIMTGVDLFV